MKSSPFQVTCYMTLMFRGWGGQRIAWYCRVTGCWTRGNLRYQDGDHAEQVPGVGWREGTRPSRLNTEYSGPRDSGGLGAW